MQSRMHQPSLILRAASLEQLADQLGEVFGALTQRGNERFPGCLAPLVFVHRNNDNCRPAMLGHRLRSILDGLFNSLAETTLRLL